MQNLFDRKYYQVYLLTKISLLEREMKDEGKKTEGEIEREFTEKVEHI